MLTKRIELNLLFKLSYLNSNFELTQGYLNPTTTYYIQGYVWVNIGRFPKFCIVKHVTKISTEKLESSQMFFVDHTQREYSSKPLKHSIAKRI